jgi:hypothetical protein
VRLTGVDRAILDLERTWWQKPGPKEWTISDQVGLDAAAYYQRLAELLWCEHAERYDPLTVRRLRRLVSQTEVARTS